MALLLHRLELLSRMEGIWPTWSLVSQKRRPNTRLFTFMASTLADMMFFLYPRYSLLLICFLYLVILARCLSSWAGFSDPVKFQEVLEELGVYVLSFDRAGYGESDPNPKRTDKSTALDIEELADQLELGSRFHVIGFSMGGEIVWTCLKYIPHRYD